MKSNYLKITFGLCVTCIIILLIILFNYYQTTLFKLVAKDKIILLTNVKSEFDTVSLSICVLLWIWVNFMVIKIKQFFWLWIPFVFSGFCIYFSCILGNDIFIFQKQNNMWNGGFSILYIAGVFMMLLVAMVLFVNYLILKKVVKKQTSI